MYLMMNIEISCKGHCESFSHFLYLVSYTGVGISVSLHVCFILDLIFNFYFYVSMIMHVWARNLPRKPNILVSE